MGAVEARRRRRRQRALRPGGPRHRHLLRRGGRRSPRRPTTSRSRTRAARTPASTCRRRCRPAAWSLLAGGGRVRLGHDQEHGRLLRRPLGEQHRVLRLRVGDARDPSAGFSATAQVARGFRDPTLSDRYFRGPTGRGFITGNPDLEPETSLQCDGALRYVAAALARGRLRLPLHDRRPDRAVPDASPTSSSSATAGARGSRGWRPSCRPRCPWRLGLELTAHRLDGKALDDDARARRASPCPP